MIGEAGRCVMDIDMDMVMNSAVNVTAENSAVQGSLAALRSGEYGRVRYIGVGGALRRRLLDLGLVENTIVRCVGVSPMGDPAAYLIRGAVIALRAADSAHIIISRGDEQWD